jgi:hypothetical protein
MSESENEEATDIGSAPSDCHDELNDVSGYSLARGAPKKPTRKDWEEFLMDESISLEDARRIKWNWGVQEHRGGDASKPFRGNMVVELHSEALDSMSYEEGIMADFGHIPGVHECLEEMWQGSLTQARGARMVKQMIDEYLLVKDGEDPGQDPASG